MRIRTLILIVLKAAVVAFVVAQSIAAKTTPESNLPARFASVALQ